MKINILIPSKAFYRLPTIYWQLAQIHATEEPPSYVSRDEFPTKKATFSMSELDEILIYKALSFINTTMIRIVFQIIIVIRHFEVGHSWDKRCNGLKLSNIDLNSRATPEGRNELLILEYSKMNITSI